MYWTANLCIFIICSLGIFTILFLLHPLLSPLDIPLILPLEPALVFDGVLRLFSSQSRCICYSLWMTSRSASDRSSLFRASAAYWSRRFNLLYQSSPSSQPISVLILASIETQRKCPFNIVSRDHVFGWRTARGTLKPFRCCFSFYLGKNGPKFSLRNACVDIPVVRDRV